MRGDVIQSSDGETGLKQEIEHQYCSTISEGRQNGKRGLDAYIDELRSLCLMAFLFSGKEGKVCGLKMVGEGSYEEGERVADDC